MIWNNPDWKIVLKNRFLETIYFVPNLISSLLSEIVWKFYPKARFRHWYAKDEMPAEGTPAWHRWRRRSFGSLCEELHKEHRWNGLWGFNKDLDPTKKHSVDEFLKYKGAAVEPKSAAFCLDCGSQMPEDLRQSIIESRKKYVEPPALMDQTSGAVT